jgi:hypothetical protein
MKNLQKQIKTKLHSAKPLNLMVVGFIVGLAVMYLFFQPKLAYQGKTAQDWAKVVSKNQDIANSNHDADTINVLLLTQKLASATAEIKTLQNQPPKIEYQTQYVQTPAQDTSLRCSSDYNGGQYCNSSDGTRLHCTTNYAGGMNCR